jgi:hypothetical protein
LTETGSPVLLPATGNLPFGLIDLTLKADVLYSSMGGFPNNATRPLHAQPFFYSIDRLQTLRQSIKL